MADQKKLAFGKKIETSVEAAEAAALPEAYAVRVDHGRKVVTHDPCPDGVNLKPVEQKTPAQWAYERVVLYIKQFEDGLDSDHEVAMGLVGSEAGSFRIQGLGYFPPDMITFYGAGEDGSRMQLVQHVNQLNLMLVAERKIDQSAEPNRIGFHLAAELEEANSKDKA